MGIDIKNIPAELRIINHGDGFCDVWGPWDGSQCQVLLHDVTMDTAEFFVAARNVYDILQRRGLQLHLVSGPGWHPGGGLFSWWALDADDNQLGNTSYGCPFMAIEKGGLQEGNSNEPRR